MKKLFSLLTTTLVYALTLATPAMIVQYYHRFVSPMTPTDIKNATIAGTLATLFLAALTGFSGKRVAPISKSLARKFNNVRATGKDSIIVRDPGSGAESLFKWNDSEKIWESDHGTYLDMDHMEEWLKQRGSDRAWANEQRKNLRNRNTAFDRDIDKMGKKSKRKGW